MAITGLYISAGDLREQVLIQTRSEARTTSGGVQETWSTTYTRRAKVETVRGMEAANLAQSEAKSDIRVFIRYQSGITPQQRLVWNSRNFDIQSVHEIGAEGRWLELMCREHQA